MDAISVAQGHQTNSIGKLLSSVRPVLGPPRWRSIIGRVEDGRGSLGHAATLRFPSPLIEPDVRISRIRLSDWLRREAHGKHRRPQASSRGVSSSFVSRYSFL